MRPGRKARCPYENLNQNSDLRKKPGYFILRYYDPRFSGGGVMNTSNEIQDTIYKQLGGHRFAVMTGAKQFSKIPNGLGFKFGRNSSKSYHLKIVLNGNDYYDLEFGHVRKHEYIIDKTFSDLCWEDLRHVFSEYTGMCLSLGRVTFGESAS